MIEQCKEAGLPTPQYYYESSGFWVTFRRDQYNEQYLQSLDLNDRQIRAILYTKENGKITNGEYQNLYNTSNRTASKNLNDIVKRDIITKSGRKGAGAFYSLK